MRRIFLPVMILLTVLAAGSAEADSGFSMRFYDLPAMVSPYAQPADDYSVSLGYPVYPRINTTLKRRPEVIATSFDSSSFRINTTYYRRGRTPYQLIPVSVDAKTFNEYQRRRNVDESFNKMVTGSLDDARQGGARGGLGVSVNLPKRLNRIFGEGGAGLRVSGYRKIIFAGRSQWTDAAESPVYSQSKFPSLNMEQIYQFDVTGNIGSKITVKVSQDSHTDIPLSNRIQLRYKGDDDDILKTVEAGNTNLSLPNTQFVGYSSRIRGLFGVKAEAQLGSFYVTAIASQEKGSSERTSVTPTGEESAKIVRDNDYTERRIFDLGSPGEFSLGDEVSKLFAYQQIQNTSGDRPPTPCTPSCTWTRTSQTPISVKTRISVVSKKVSCRSARSRTSITACPTPTGTTSSSTAGSRDFSFGVYMEIKRADGSIDTIGTDASGTVEDPKLLKLIYARAAQPSYKTWNYMWRNIYDIPIGTTIDDIEIKVYWGATGNENSSSAREYQELTEGHPELHRDCRSRPVQCVGAEDPDGRI